MTRTAPVLRFPALPALFLAAASLAASAQPRILVYTRNHVTNGKGYVHNNIQASVEAIRALGAANGFAVDHSDDPAAFTGENLNRYGALVFSNSNNEAFSSGDQRDAFQRYLRGGRGLVGIHSATGSERAWPWFWSVMGGKFLRHPKMQKFVVRVKDPSHPAVRGLPAQFEWEDECYYHDHLSPALKPLLVTDPAALDDPKKAEYPGDRFGDSLPLVWYQTVEGGREIYIALGHKIEHYQDPRLTALILNAIRWALDVK
jgi:type 1 glutamine amidotransferase